jgi:hypothetical protein
VIYATRDTCGGWKEIEERRKELYPYTTRMIVDEEQKIQLLQSGEARIERTEPYKGRLDDPLDEVKVFLVSGTTDSWRIIGYGTAVLHDRSPQGKYHYAVKLQKKEETQDRK